MVLRKRILIVLGLASSLTFVAASPAMAAVAFGATQTFEADTVGSQPDAWFDGDTGWYGEIQVVASGTDGVSASLNGGSQFAKITPGAENSYFGGAARDAAYSRVGTSTPFPASGDTYSVFRDVYFQSTGSTGHFWINPTIRNTGGSYLTEASYRFTTGSSSWNVKFALGDVSGVDLATDTWYTLKETWDRSGALVAIIYEIYSADSGSLLHSETTGTYNDVLSSDLGGPGAHSWFTAWDNSAIPSAVYVDNVGTSSPVPEPTTLAIWGMFGGLGLIAARRRRRAA